MEGPRSPEPREFSRFIDFIQTHLGEAPEWSIAQEYPLVLNPQNTQNMRWITSGDQVLSAAAFKNLLVKTPIGFFRVGAIGSVVTHPEYRNQGCSHRVIQSCLELAEQQICDLVLLWSDLHDFYQKQGFVLSGSELNLEIDQPLRVNTLQYHCEGPTRMSSETVARLYSAHRSGVIRTLKDIEEHLKIPNARIYVAKNQEGLVQAYAIEGKGRDLIDHVHEWGGSVSALLRLFDFMFEARNEKPFSVLCPQHSENLVRQLVKHNVKLHSGFLGLMRIINPYSVMSKVKRQAFHMGFADFVLKQQGETFLIGFGPQLFEISSKAALTQLLFGPEKPSQLQVFDEVTAQKLDVLLPIPFWIWGWDSV